MSKSNAYYIIIIITVSVQIFGIVALKFLTSLYIIYYISMI